MFNKNTNTNIPFQSNSFWLDLELRKDIDDYLTLIYCLESGVPIRAVSINNPSINELKLLNLTMRQFERKTPIVYTGEVTTYLQGEDLQPVLLKKVANESEGDLDVIRKLGVDPLSLGGATVFCGGSLTTLKELIRLTPNDSKIKACIQGGYAGPLLMDEAKTLKKFKKRKMVPTWNLNLDLEASKDVLNASNVNCMFVSKDICHDSWVTDKDLEGSTSIFASAFKEYLDDIEWSNKKCLHDVLAFMSMRVKGLVEFKSVKLNFKTSGLEGAVSETPYTKWWSEPAPEGGFPFISVAYDKELFLSSLKAL